MSLFESTITGNILNDGQTPITTIEMQGVSAGQLATVLTAYTPLTDTTANTAAIGTNSAAVAALQAQVAALPSPPDLTPYALAADLAAAEGLVAANSSSIALRTTPADVDQKIATALLPLVAQTVLDAALALRDGRLDAAEAAIAALQGAQTAADVASALAAALASHTDTAGLNALLAVRDARLDGHNADILALQGAGPFATAAELSASETSLQSAIDALNAALAALTTGGGTNLANAQAWPGQTTWDLLVGTNTIRNWHFQAALSASLANDNFTLSLACDAYSQAEVDALLAPLASESWVTVQMDAAIAAAVAGIDLSAYVPWTGLQADVLTKGRIFADSSLGVATAGSFQAGILEPLLLTDQFLNLKAGTVSVRVTDQADQSLCTFASSEVHSVARGCAWTRSSTSTTPRARSRGW